MPVSPILYQRLGGHASESKKNRIVIWVITAFGVIAFVSGVAALVLTVKFVNSAVETTARVVHVQISYGDDSTTYKPTVQFRDTNGRTVEAESWMSSSSYDFNVGEKIPILYDPADPENIRLNYFFEKWGFGVILTGIGGFMVLVGRMSRGRMRKPKIPAQAKPRRPKPTREESAKYVELPSRESPADHARETNYKPTVRRNR